MWPFRRAGAPRFRRVDDRYSVTGQIRPEDLPAIAEAGFTLILCTRSDGEAAGQPPFAAIAAEAARIGIAARHIPVSGAPGPGQAAAFRVVMAEAAGPVLGWCRSGARAEALHARAARQEQ